MPAGWHEIDPAVLAQREYERRVEREREAAVMAELEREIAAEDAAGAVATVEPEPPKDPLLARVELLEAQRDASTRPPVANEFGTWAENHRRDVKRLLRNRKRALEQEQRDHEQEERTAPERAKLERKRSEVEDRLRVERERHAQAMAALGQEQSQLNAAIQATLCPPAELEAAAA